MKKFKIAIWDGLVLGALIVLAWGRSAQTILMAVVAFLLYLLVRSNLAKSTAGLSVGPRNNEFVVENDDFCRSEVDLDSDIDFRPRKYHFRIDSRYETASRDAEYEYKVEGTGVFVRLLHESLEDISLSKVWEVRDGVVLETDLRERWKTDRSRNVEEDIAARKKATEWQEILSYYWNGLKYFILLRNLPTEDVRRFFRQEIERLKLGSNRYIEEATRIGFVLDETSMWRLRLPDGVDPGKEQRQKLFDSISNFGISYDEFTMAPGLIAALEKYLN